MYITPFNSVKNNKQTFGVGFSDELYKPLNNLFDQVFKIDRYVKKRARKNPSLQKISLSAKQRLRETLAVIDMIEPSSQEKIYPYIDYTGKAFLAVNKNGKPILLSQLNKNKFNDKNDLSMLKIKLFDLETAAYKLYKLDRREKLLRPIKLLLGKIGLKF